MSFTSSTGGTWEFVYDITAGIPAVIIEETPTGTVYYIREPNGALIARVSGNDIHYYHFDALGSTRMLTDGSGSVTDTYAYDAWGNVTARTGSTDQPYQYVGRLGYYTHYQHANFDLLQLGVRFYDPEIGRFTQVDPIKDGMNWYAYVENRPVKLRDSTGLRPNAGREACSYYDKKCEEGLKLACVMAPVCRTFGESKLENCIRGCLIVLYDICARLDGVKRMLCEGQYMGSGHAFCARYCSDNICMEWITDRLK